eukprot:4571520-Prymnesium_polylepis.2
MRYGTRATRDATWDDARRTRNSGRHPSPRTPRCARTRRAGPSESSAPRTGRRRGRRTHADRRDATSNERRSPRDTKTSKMSVKTPYTNDRCVNVETNRNAHPTGNCRTRGLTRGLQSVPRTHTAHTTFAAPTPPALASNDRHTRHGCPCGDVQQQQQQHRSGFFSPQKPRLPRRPPVLRAVSMFIACTTPTTWGCGARQ